MTRYALGPLVTDRIAKGPVGRWIDADTVVMAELSLGWAITIRDDPRRQTTHIRLSGVNAPDDRSNAKWYDPGLKAAGLTYVNTRYPSGTMFVLVSHGLDDFGRSLADVYELSTGYNVGEELTSYGYVRTGDYPIAPKES